MVDCNHYYLYADDDSDIYFFYKYGIFPYSKRIQSEIMLHDTMSLTHKYNVQLSQKGLFLEKGIENIFICREHIPPENIICTIDKNGKIYNRIIIGDEKPKHIYHGTTIDYLKSILKCGYIMKSPDYSSGHFVFGFSKKDKSGCMYYGGMSGCILKINTANYNVLRVGFSSEYCIDNDVSVFDIESVEFYLKGSLICEWDKETIENKKEYVLNTTHLNIETPIVHFMRSDLEEKTLFDIYNDFILR